ncbi:MAG: CmcI family methyltransferase [Rhizobiaceae bacterium]
MSTNAGLVTELSAELANAIQRGTMAYSYKGIRTLKSPFDLSIYQDVIWTLKPATIIEFGTFKGGSALWLADLLQAYQLDKTKLITLDLHTPEKFSDPRIEFRQCDVKDIAAALPDDFMKQLLHPILVIDDASHKAAHVTNVMDFFHRYSVPGDYLIVEDAILSLIMNDADFGGGPIKAIHEFLKNHPDTYEIDRARCDTFGHNVTWNPDGYIRRTR